MLTKSGDEVGIRGVQAADLGAHRSPQSGRLSLLATAPARPAVRNPKSWLSRKPELDVTVGRSGARCPSWGAAGPRRLVWALVESRQPALLSRFRSTAVSRLDAVVEVGEGGVLPAVPPQVCVCGVSARCPLRGGLLGGREGVGDSLGGGGGGEGCWFLTPSQPVQDTFLPEITAGGEPPYAPPLPFLLPPTPKTTNLSSSK